MAVLAACQADAHVDLTMREDGSGQAIVTVDLDREAAARVPALAHDLRVADLEATGWTVAGPTDTDGGGVRLTATKPFATAAQGRQVLREIGGRGGVLRGLTLRRSHTFGETSWKFAGMLDFSDGLAAFSDADLDAVLGSEAFGQDQSALEAQLGEPLADTLSVSVTATLPGADVQTNGDPGWSAKPGDEPVAMATTSSQRDTKALLLAAAAAVTLFLLLLLGLVRLIRGRRRRRSERRARGDGVGRTN